MDLQEMFDDTAYHEYMKRMEEKARGLENNLFIIPQYINDIKDQNNRDVDVIVISSDEEEYYDSTYDSDSTYYTAYNDEGHIDKGEDSDNYGMVPTINTNGYNKNIDNDVEFLYEVKGTQKKIKKLKTNRRCTRLRYIARRKQFIDDNIILVPYYAFPYPIRCYVCDVITLRQVRDSLSNLCQVRNDRKFYCLGCARFNQYITCTEEYSDVINWLVTGNIPFYDRPIELTTRELISRLRSRRICMERRAERFRESNCSSMITTAELHQLCVEKDFKCAITGHSLFINPHGTFHTPYWSLTFDHIEPLKYSKQYPQGWAKENIQMMCTILNSIKGHVGNEELIAWYKRFMRKKSNGL